MAGHLAAATCRFLVLLAEFDERRGWASWELGSCAAWLSWRCQLASGTAREHVRVARALRDLPVIRAEFAAARLSYAKVRALTRIATPATEGQLAVLAVPMTGNQLERFARAHRQCSRGGGAGRGRGAAGRFRGNARPRPGARPAGGSGGSGPLSWMRHARDGTVLDLGRRRRRPSAALRKAARERDRGRCRYPGCESRRTDLHHIRHWSSGGRTDLDNLVSLCRRHHTAVHDRGYLIAAGPGGAFAFFRPDGTPLPTCPPLPAPDGHIAAVHDAEVTPDTIIPPWSGERLDLDYAIYTCLANERIYQDRAAGRDSTGPDDGSTGPDGGASPARRGVRVFEPGDWYPVLRQYQADQAAAGEAGRIPFPDWFDQRKRAARSSAPAA